MANTNSSHFTTGTKYTILQARPITVYSRVMAEKVVSEAVEETWVFWREEAIVDLVNGLLQLWVALIVLPRVISVRAEKERVLYRWIMKAMAA